MVTIKACLFPVTKTICQTARWFLRLGGSNHNQGWTQVYHPLPTKSYHRKQQEQFQWYLFNFIPDFSSFSCLYSFSLFNNRHFIHTIAVLSLPFAYVSFISSISFEFRILSYLPNVNFQRTIIWFHYLIKKIAFSFPSSVLLPFDLCRDLCMKLLLSRFVRHFYLCTKHENIMIYILHGGHCDFKHVWQMRAL